MAELGPEDFKVFPTCVSQLINPFIKQVLIALKDA
jgi:hypothetical protein